METLKDYRMIDNNTQIDKDGKKYSIYGVNTNSGVLFERDINNQNIILRHVSNGIKEIDGCFYSDSGDIFFYKDDHEIYLYRRKNYNDFKYADSKVNVDKNQKIMFLKEFIYLHKPYIGCSTLLGWKRKDGDKSEIYNPNHCTAHIQFDDGERYTVIKVEDTVKLFAGNVDMLYFEKHPELCLLMFKLDKNLYDTAYELLNIKRDISSKIFGNINDDLFKKYMHIKEYIINNLNGYKE